MVFEKIKITYATEQPIYGSARLGQYRGGRAHAKQTLGLKHYELTNHLGNVLSVVTDNINISPDSAFAKIVAATDYYAFGSEMPARTYSGGGQEEAYRYGFNGKEKDTEHTWGDTSYDYGFRIYNPRYGRFLSVDPLFRSYAMLTPYQFASNTPISAIDRDGLEAEIVINSPWFFNKIKIAWDAGDVDEAQRLAWVSINRDRPPDRKGSTEIQNKYKGALTAGTYNWNEANPNVLTVFDSDGNEMFRIIKQDPPKIIEKESGTGLLDWIKNLFDWDIEGSGSSQESGIHFYAEGGKGFTRAKSRTLVKSIDITVLYTYLSTTKFGPNGPPQFQIEEFTNTMSSVIQTAKDIKDTPEKRTRRDSCVVCHQISEDGKKLKHAYETQPTRGKYTSEEAKDLNKRTEKSNK